MDARSFGKRVASQRQSLGLTQAELAAMIQVTPKTISWWECGRGFPDATLWMPLAKALHLDVSDLMNPSAEQNRSTPAPQEPTHVQASSTGSSDAKGTSGKESNEIGILGRILSRLPFFEIVLAICMIAFMMIPPSVTTTLAGTSSIYSILWGWCTVFGIPLSLFCIGRIASRLLIRRETYRRNSLFAATRPEPISILMLGICMTGFTAYVLPPLQPRLFYVLSFVPLVVNMCPLFIWLILGALQGIRRHPLRGGGRS